MHKFTIRGKRYHWRIQRAWRNRPSVWFFHNPGVGILHIGPLEFFYPPHQGS